ncbi:hypothetical protein HOC_13484 [Hyphomonas oceanitis SCH89]|uniref:Uncharacterized protein n=1 Tax=Hyphomonas oceanitis SCH89 TaxID=1280953 RepID=A0A059G4L1_9PROT|nr:hypothetical protein HOC_13484 [Hyphomonas oceanitis SCH89]
MLRHNKHIYSKLYQKVPNRLFWSFSWKPTISNKTLLYCRPSQLGMPEARYFKRHTTSCLERQRQTFSVTWDQLRQVMFREEGRILRHQLSQEA